MPNYKPVIETIGVGQTALDVAYEIGNEVSLSYPVGTYDANTETYNPQGTTSSSSYEKDRYYTIPSSTYRQTWKLPTEVSETPCSTNTNLEFYVSEYSDASDRIVYLNDDLQQSLNAEYTGCCFDENGNFVAEPSLNQKRVTDIILEGIEIDKYGKISTDSGIVYLNGCTNVSIDTIIRTETFTVTFNSMVPNIASSAPYLDDDITVKLERSDGSSVVATASTGTVSMSAVAPQTITIKFEGQLGRKIFPEETWEYYYEKNTDFTPNPDHLKFDIDRAKNIPFELPERDVSDELIKYDERKPDPNERFEPYRINKDNNSGSIVDLSLEIPNDSILFGYGADITNRSAGTNPIDGSTSRAGHRDIVFNFSVTSTISAFPATTVWAIGVPLSTGSYCTNGSNTYYVEFGGTPSSGTPGTPGDPNATPPVPPTSGTPADSGPSGTGFFIDESGMRYRYIPPTGLITTAGAGDFSTTLYVMNDYRGSQQVFEDRLDTNSTRRVK